MSEPSGVDKLAFAVLLAAAKKGAHAFRIRPDGVDYVVEHRIGDATVEEMRGSSTVMAAVIRRLSVMASLPVFAKGESASGTLHLQVGEDRELFFAVHVTGHGPALALDGRVLAPPD